jgi:hypothetical protein
MMQIRERLQQVEAALDERVADAEGIVVRARRRLQRERELVQPTEELPVGSEIERAESSSTAEKSD